MTQAAFAKKFRINLRTLQGWEAGRFKPNARNMDRLEKIGQ